MDPTAFEAVIDRMDRLEDVWAETVVFARGRCVGRLGYHHLPPPSAPDVALLRVENDGFGAALLARISQRGRRGWRCWPCDRVSVVAGLRAGRPND